MQLSGSVTGVCHNDGDDDRDLEGTPKCQRLTREEVLERSLASGLYPQFIGCDGPSQLLDPHENDELAFLQLVEQIAVETSRYAPVLSGLMLYSTNFVGNS